MKRSFLPALFFSLALASCNPPATTQSDTSRTSLDWPGSYNGILPCADCEGILTTLTLMKDEQYSLNTTYLGKSREVNQYKGKFSWNEAGNTITLKGLDGIPSVYQVGENRLIQLDMNGKPITGGLADRYILGKISDEISGKYWKLTEVMGKPVTFTEGSRREAHFILHPSQSRVTGNGSCNGFFGTYQLGKNERITFSNMGSTQMFCEGAMETETAFLKALQTADSYYVRNDSLQLNRARMAPLAKFVAVYLR